VSIARATLLACLLGARAASLAAQADTSAPPHDPTTYDITLVTSDTGAHILGEVQTGWRLRTVNPVEMALDSVFRVVRVLVDGKPNTRLSRTMYARQGSEVVVPHEKAPGDTLTTRVRYHGIPRGGIRVGADRTGRRALAGETAGDRAWRWLPVPERSGSEGSGSEGSGADASARVVVNWHIQASEGQRAVANGTLVKIDTLAYGHSTWQYQLGAPIPLDALAVAVGTYAVTTLSRPSCKSACAPVTVWTAPEDSASAAAGAFGRAGEIVDFLSGWLGPFPYPSLAHVASSLPPAGRPGASIVLWDEGKVHGGAIEEDAIARATAAQWLGNAVTELGPAAERPGAAASAYLAWLWDRHSSGGRPQSEALTRDVDAIRKLHRMLGDSVFARGLRRYVEANRNAPAPAGAFERAMSEAAGRRLDWSFAARPR
jgi:aminopeptidase N